MVIVVDDDAALLNALDFALEAYGFAVEVFQTAQAAFAAAALEKAACLVIDQILPDEAGLDLLYRLRARGNSTPAILITSNPGRGLVARAAELDVPIVEKPLLDDQLFACIRRLIVSSA